MKALLFTLPFVAAAGLVRMPEPQDKALVGKRVSLQFEVQIDARGTWDALAGMEGTVENADAVGLTVRPSRVITRQVRLSGESVLGDAPAEGRFFVPWSAVKCLHYPEK